MEGGTTRNTSLPSIANISLSAKDGLVSLRATNLEFGVVVSAPANIIEEGEVLIAPRVLNVFLGGAGGGDLSFQSEGQHSLLIKEDRRSATIQVEDVGEFPIIPYVADSNTAIIPPVKFIPALASVVNSASLSEAKPELSGIYFDISEKEVVLAATDSFRLSEVRLQQQGSAQNALQCIIPLRFANLAIKAFSDGGDDVRIALDENQIAFRGEVGGCDVYLISKVIEGEYPAYTSIIPSEFVTTALLSRSSFVDSVRGAGAFSSRAQTIRLDFEKGKVFVSGEGDDVGSFQESLDCEVDGDAVSLIFNYHYLLDGLQNIQEDHVSVKVSRKDGPVLLQGVQNKAYLYLVMPIRDT